MSPEETEMTRTETTGIEEALRAMLAADAELLQERDLAPFTPLPAPRRQRPRRAWTAVAVTGAAAATAGILVGAHVLGMTDEPDRRPTGPATSVATPQPPLSITFESRTTTLTNPAATVTVPVPHVSATDPQVAQRVSDAIGEELAGTQGGFRNRITDPGVVALRPAGTELTQDVTATTVSWKQFVTVRFDDVETGGVIWDDGTARRPLTEHSALVFDATTGARVLPPDLFTDLEQVVAAVRSVLVAEHADHVTADNLASLSLKPSEGGTTTPLTCYPTPDGLRCAVDDGALTPGYTGPLESTVPWQTLTPLLQPRLRG